MVGPRGCHMLGACSLRLAALGVLGVLLLGTADASAQPAVQAARTQARPPLQPQAVDVLKAVGARLAAAHTVSVVAVETIETVSGAQGPSVSTKRSDVTLQRPDKLRVLVSGGATPQSASYCNGNTMMTYSPDDKTLVIAKAPPTITECLRLAYRASAIDPSFIDVIVADSYNELIPGLTRAS